MELDLDPGTYLVIGGTSGMGHAAATALARSGASLTLVGRDAGKAERAAARLAVECGVPVHSEVADVAARGDVARELVARVVDRGGPLRGVAITSGTPVTAHKPLLEASDDDWDVAIQEVLMGTVRVAKAAIPELIAAGGGTIVTTSAYSIRDPSGQRSPYTTAKGALPVFTKDIARAFGDRGVRANCVAPGVIATESAQRRGIEMHRQWGDPVESFDDVFKKTGMSIALGRPGTATEIGDVIAFLMSKNSSYITGATINIDGGTIF